jgi:hypothetical protein
MKAVFGCLLCLVLATSHTYAIKGGPPITKGGVNVIGTYAGVLHPPFCPLANPAQCGGSLNSLGLFSLGIPQAGLASGSVALFTGERTFVGSIQGVADPTTGGLEAAMQGIPVVSGGGITIFTLNFHADGFIHAKIKTPKSTTAISLGSTRVQGTAVITTTNRNVTPPDVSVTNYTVDGFKQSNTASAATGGALPSASPAGGQ